MHYVIHWRALGLKFCFSKKIPTLPDCGPQGQTTSLADKASHAVVRPQSEGVRHKYSNKNSNNVHCGTRSPEDPGRPAVHSLLASGF
jgi:hypothetical protein